MSEKVLPPISVKALKREKRVVQKAPTRWSIIRRASIDAFFRMFRISFLLDNFTMASVLLINYSLSLYFLYEWMSGVEALQYHGAILSILWMTSYFAQFSETMAMGRGKAQADALKSLETTTTAKKLSDLTQRDSYEELFSCDVQPGDLLLVERGEVIPVDGEVMVGAALIDESAVTGESAPVIREAGGDLSAVTGGTTVLSDSLVMKVTSRAGEGFLAKMIQLVEGSQRRKTPNEEALSVLLTACTTLFAFVVLLFACMFNVRVDQIDPGKYVLDIDPFLLGVMFVCLIPTTISALLPAIGIAGMDRLMKFNIIAMSSRAIEAAGDADILMLDKTGTITLGNRQASEFFPATGISLFDCTKAAYLASLEDDTPEGKSIVRLALEKFPELEREKIAQGFSYIPFSAKTRMSGIFSEDTKESYYKGAIDSIEKNLQKELQDSRFVIDSAVRSHVEQIALQGETPLVVSHNGHIVGSVALKDIVKPGLKDRFSLLRLMGIQTIMITGDNPLTAAAIAAEAGVDKFYGQVTPEKKLEIIVSYQEKGHIVAMTGDGSNDAPALAQADVAMAMNSGTQAAREAANLIDLDSNPTKLLEIVHVGKDLLITRGALTTFSIANDIAKYFVLLPALISSISPKVALYISWVPLSSPKNGCLAAALFNGWIILFLIPLALRGVRTKIASGESMFRKNLLFWGTLGLFSPFFGIIAFDSIIHFFE